MRDPRFASIDTLFALPEACLYAGIIDLLEARTLTVDYARVFEDIRESIDTVHRDNSLKSAIRERIGHFVFKDPELGPTLHKLRSGGKKLFLLTNSLWDYTDLVMRYLLDGVLPDYPTWRRYFDLVITGAAKPAFFGEGSAFLSIDDHSAKNRTLGPAHSLERGKVYQGGNLADFERMTGFSGERILYVGDHIYGDILKSKKTSLWRTCMVVHELEDEIRYTDSRRADIARLSEMEGTRCELDDEVSLLKSQFSAAERAGASEEERRRIKSELERARRSLREATQVEDALELDLERGFNAAWGLLFKEGHENSRFGEQVEKYACLYTSRVSNFLRYSPAQYFRSGRGRMAHERTNSRGP
jgi:hypothetical protein